MAELVLRNVRPMGGPVADVLARDGMIARIGPGVEPTPHAIVIDGDRGIVLPGLVDAHMHLDKTFWGLPWRPHEAGPTTLERIENERRLRRELRLRWWRCGLIERDQVEQILRGRGGLAATQLADANYSDLQILQTIQLFTRLRGHGDAQPIS